MRRARLLVTYEVLEQALRLYDIGIEAIAPQTADEVGLRMLSLIVSGDDLPKHLEGAPLRIVKLIDGRLDHLNGG